MVAPIPLRTDYDGARLRRLARESRDGPQVRRLLALAAIYDGAARGEAARIGGVGLQVLRDWVLRFNADGPAGLVDRKAPGKPPALDDAHRRALALALATGPDPEADGVERWSVAALADFMRRRFGLSVSASTVRRELRAMGHDRLAAPRRDESPDDDPTPGAQPGAPRRR